MIDHSQGSQYIGYSYGMIDSDGLQSIDSDGLQSSARTTSVGVPVLSTQSSLSSHPVEMRSRYRDVVYRKNYINLPRASLIDSMEYTNGERGFQAWEQALLQCLKYEFIRSIISDNEKQYRIAYYHIHRWRLATSHKSVLENLKKFGDGKGVILSVSAALQSYHQDYLTEIADLIQKPVAADMFS